MSPGASRSSVYGDGFSPWVTDPLSLVPGYSGFNRGKMTTQVNSSGSSSLEFLFVLSQAQVTVHSLHGPVCAGPSQGCKHQAAERSFRPGVVSGQPRPASPTPLQKRLWGPSQFLVQTTHFLTVALTIEEMSTLAESLVIYTFNRLLLQKKNLTPT